MGEINSYFSIFCDAIAKLTYNQDKLKMVFTEFKAKKMTKLVKNYVPGKEMLVLMYQSIANCSTAPPPPGISRQVPTLSVPETER